MKLILIFIIGFLFLWWQMPKRISKIFKPIDPTYPCLFEKKIVISRRVTQEDPWWMDLLLSGYVINLYRKIDLSFPPQIGFSVSELINLSDDEVFTDRIRFSSGKIEHINWNNYSKEFECESAIHEIATKHDLGAALVDLVAAGWIVKEHPSSVSVSGSAIKTFLMKWKASIESEEEERQKPLPAVWEALEKVQKLLRMQTNLAEHIFE